MTVTPQINADFEDYPELQTLYNAAIRRVIDLMQIHNIATLRRLTKVGVFDSKYTKDIVVPAGISGVPATVSAVQYSVAGALLDYLNTIGIQGVTLDLTAADVNAIGKLWNHDVAENTQKEQDSPALTPEAINVAQASADAAVGNVASDTKHEGQKKE